MMNSLKFENTKVLFVTKENDRNLVLAARNIPYTNVQKAPDFSVYDILNANFVVFQKSAIEIVNEVLA